MERSAHSRSLAATALALALLAGTSVGLWTHDAAGQEAGPTSEGAFVFSRSMSGTYLVTAGSQTQVSFAHGDYIRPRLLPGHRKVLLNSRRGGRPGIWIEDVDGENRERVCDGDQVGVAPDGRSIAFRREGAILHRDLASGAEGTLSPRGWDACSHPSFCPDGRVLFVSTNQGRDRVCITDVGGAEPPNVLFEAEIKSAPRCSPDGRTIAYQHGAHIYLFDAVAERHRRLTLAGGVQSWPMWSSDGQSLAYLQSPGAIDGPWHVYRVEIGEPGRVFLVLRNVDPGPGWNGVGFAGGVSSDLKGNGIRLWHSEQPVRVPPDADELPHPEGGWASLPGDGGVVTGDLLVECEWGGLYLSAATGRGLLARRRGDGLAQTAQIRLLGGGVEPFARIESLTVSAVGRDELEVRASLRRDGGGVAQAAFVVSRARPVVEVRPGDRVTAVALERRLQRAVVPDRLAGDLIYNPADYDSPRILLPGSPFVLGMASDNSGLLMLVTPSSKQSVELVRHEEPDAFAALLVQCGGESVFLSFLPGEGLWRPTDVRPAQDAEGWSVTWSNPFPAQWRLAVQSRETSLAVMAGMDTPTSEKGIPLEGGRALTSAPDEAIIYTYGRSQNTPLDQMMPTDILRDALGIDGAWSLLDIEGIRTYRHADEWVPYKDPRVALKIISWVRARQRPGGQEKIDDVCRDILLSLRGLDARIREYESFVGETWRVCRAETPSAATAALAERLDRGLAHLDEQLRRRPVPPMDHTMAKVVEFRDNRRAAYMPFSSSVTAALYPRVDRVKAHRAFAKSVRRDAGLMLAASPGSRDLCEQLRTLAGQVLRKRCYLEADWLGEEPLGEPEVPYEQIDNL